MTARLDAAVAARGLARSRTQAAQLIEAGLVSVDGAPVVKPGSCHFGRISGVEGR